MGPQSGLGCFESWRLSRRFQRLCIWFSLQYWCVAGLEFIICLSLSCFTCVFPFVKLRKEYSKQHPGSQPLKLKCLVWIVKQLVCFWNGMREHEQTGNLCCFRQSNFKSCIFLGRIAGETRTSSRYWGGKTSQWECFHYFCSDLCSLTDVSPESPDHYLTGHCIDGRVLYPATGYLVLAWRTLARSLGMAMEEMAVMFEDVTIHQATIIPKKGEWGVLV